MRAGWILALGGMACLSLAWRPGSAPLMWNATASVPVGLYRLSPADPLAVGDLIVVRPPGAVADLLARRGWLPAGVPLLKPVAALGGQQVCRAGQIITVDGVAAAMARARDRQGRPLPDWRGCRRLERGEVLALNPASADSFDGRYFGPLPRDAILARATPLWLPRGGRP
jgi:conjugative transfer signal peptidase TraF